MMWLLGVLWPGWFDGRRLFSELCARYVRDRSVVISYDHIRDVLTVSRMESRT